MKKEDKGSRLGGGGVDEEAVAADDVDIKKSPPEFQQHQDDGDVTSLPSQSLPASRNRWWRPTGWLTSLP